MPFPKYRRFTLDHLDGRELVVEDLSDTHCRFYLADRQGQLRLIYLNDGARIHALADDVLMCQFGVTLFDLGLHWAAPLRHAHARLDHLCEWPKALFPMGPPALAPLPEHPEMLPADSPLSSIISNMTGRDAWV